MESNYQGQFRSWAIDAFLNTSSVDLPDITWFGKCINKALTNPEKKSKLPFFVFGLCGNAGTGKDSAIEYLSSCPYINPVIRMAFADPIREIGKLFGFSMNQMTDRTLKETVDPFWGFSPRTFMQKVGTEMFRNCLREDIWIQLLTKRLTDLSERAKRGEIATPSMVFITDVRFPNEAQAIRDMGGYIVKIVREGFSKSGENLHPSEKFINEMKADVTIENKYPNANIWTWSFTKWLMIWLKHDAFYYNINRGE
jgi:hypothetical protein